MKRIPVGTHGARCRHLGHVGCGVGGKSAAPFQSAWQHIYGWLAPLRLVVEGRRRALELGVFAFGVSCWLRYRRCARVCVRAWLEFCIALYLTSGLMMRYKPLCIVVPRYSCTFSVRRSAKSEVAMLLLNSCCCRPVVLMTTTCTVVSAVCRAVCMYLDLRTSPSSK